MYQKTILITGGTGSLGKALIPEIAKYKPYKIIVFSRDEYKQSEMQKSFDYPCLRYFIGDVRDKQRLMDVFGNVDIVIHAAALKQVPAMEYNPTEAVKTNIIGSMNVIEAAIYNNVDKTIGISTDKAVNPINLYGATKLTMEKLFTAANSYGKTKFSCVRYGNVIGSRGSVVELFKKLIEQGVTELPVTDGEMTRFWITLKQAVSLVLTAMDKMNGGEIFVPRLPSMTMFDLASVFTNTAVRKIGIRPGEKMHECLVSEDYKNVKIVNGYDIHDAKEPYYSNTNDWFLTRKEFKELLC